jgi:hypothetical protein
MREDVSKVTMTLVRHSDPYIRFGQQAVTSPTHRCCCRSLTTTYLAHVFTENPIHCSSCRGAVSPERIGFDAATADSIARWNTVYGALYELWLDCGKYEMWAESELLRPDSHVNASGLRAREQLSRYIPCRYLWFWQERSPAHCPVCGSSLGETEGSHRVCTPCGIYV